MKKIKLLAFSLACGMLCMSLAACGGGLGPAGPADPPEHKHTFETTWTYDETYHWHKATCEHKSLEGDKEEHDLEGGKCTVCDYEEKEEEIPLAYELDEETDTYTVAGIGNVTGDTVIIPSRHEGKSVTKIGKKAFYATADEPNTTLKSVKIPATVTEIDNNAFTHCQALAEVEFGGTQIIGSSAFWDTALVNINLKNIVTINKYAFYECTSLESVVLSDSLKTIVDYAFYGDTALESAILGNGVETIGDYAFYGDTALATVSLGNKLEAIGKSAFRKCAQLTEVTLPQGLQTVGDYAFYECTALGNISVPDSLTSVGKYAFAKHAQPLSVHFGGDITAWLALGDDVFTGLFSDYGSTVSGFLPVQRELYLGGKKVEGTLTIPNGVTRIPKHAFYGVNAITSVSIPKSVTTVAEGAFFNYTGHNSDVTMSVYYAGNLVDYCNMEDLSGLYFMSDSAELYLGGQKLTGSLVIPEGITRIPSGAFFGLRDVTSLSVPKSVTEVGEAAFVACGIAQVTYAGTYKEYQSVFPFGNKTFWGSGVKQENSQYLITITCSDWVPISYYSSRFWR